MPRRDRIPETFAETFVICPDLEPYDSAVTYAMEVCSACPSRVDSAAKRFRFGATHHTATG